jgi:hypothetical protein
VGLGRSSHLLGAGVLMGAVEMDREKHPADRSIIDGLLVNDPETIEWLRRLGLVEIGADGQWHATALRRNGVVQPYLQPQLDTIWPPRPALH